MRLFKTTTSDVKEYILFIAVRVQAVHLNLSLYNFCIPLQLVSIQVSRVSELFEMETIITFRKSAKWPTRLPNQNENYQSTLLIWPAPPHFMVLLTFWLLLIVLFVQNPVQMTPPPKLWYTKLFGGTEIFWKKHSNFSFQKRHFFLQFDKNRKKSLPLWHYDSVSPFFTKFSPKSTKGSFRNSPKWSTHLIGTFEDGF